MANDSWESKATAKREAILEAIPREWRIQVPSVEQRIDVTGEFVQRYLSDREIEITETTADGIVKHTVAGLWAAEEVARAFCHRAALAHQLVCSVPEYHALSILCYVVEVCFGAPYPYGSMTYCSEMGN